MEENKELRKTPTHLQTINLLKEHLNRRPEILKL
jgi:hypothetical protein